MNDAFGMGDIESVRDFYRQIEEKIEFKRATRYAMLQGRAFEKFHHDEGMAVVLGDFVNSADIWVIQSGSSARFSAKTFQSLRIAGDVFGQKFQGDEAAEFGVFSLVHHAHSTAAQLLQDAVVRNCPAGNWSGVGH